MKEGNESYMVWISHLTFLVVNYTSYQSSNLFKTTTTGTYATTLLKGQ